MYGTGVKPYKRQTNLQGTSWTGPGYLISLKGNPAAELRSALLQDCLPADCPEQFGIYFVKLLWRMR